MPDIQFSSTDYANADLFDGLTQRPKSAVPLNIPIDIKPKPDGAPAIRSSLENSFLWSEQAAMREYFRNEQAQRQAREQEIANREQAQRNELRNRVPTAEPPPSEPRITNRNPEWESPPKTAERPTQPTPPSSASPPRTANNSGARVGSAFEPTAGPAPVGLREVIPPNRPITSTPNPLPIPAGSGRAVAGGAAVGAGVDLVNRIIHGQPPQQAAFGAAGNFAGSVAGAAIGAGFGPPGMFIGGMIGGFAGGFIADLIYNAAHPPAAYPPPDPYQGPPPFEGGQELAKYKFKVKLEKRLKIGGIGNTIGPASYEFYGKIGGLEFERFGESLNVYVRHSVGYGLGNSSGQRHLIASGLSEFDGQYVGNIYDLQRIDNEPDTGGNPPPTPIPYDYRTPASITHPGNQNFPPPSGSPAAGNNPAPNNYAPGGFAAGSSPRGDSPNWVPHAGPAPQKNPNPVTTPGNLGGGLPGIIPSPSPGSSSNGSPSSSGNPGDQPNPPGPRVVHEPPGGGSPHPGNPAGPTVFYGPGYPSPKPGNFGDNNVKPVPFGGGSTIVLEGPPSGIPTTTSPNPTPDATSPTPKNQDPLAPPILFFPPAPSPPISKETVKEGVCEASQPGGCLGKPLDNIQNSANQSNSKLDQLNALLSGLDLAGLAAINQKIDLINNKLGPQLPNGGIGGHLQRFTKWLRLDRVLNVMIWINTLHNAYMLSSSLTDTLFSAVDNILNVFIQDSEGVDIDTKSIIGTTIDNAAKQIFGVETWTGIKANWKKLNRIYQAAANIANSVRSMIDSVRNISEFIAENTGKIGNALKRFGAVGEKAYNWMPEHVKARSIWVQRLENAQEAASGLEMVSSEVVSIKDNLKELTEQKEEFEKSIEDLEPKEQKDNKPIKNKVEQSAVVSKSPSIPAISSDADKEEDN